MRRRSAAEHAEQEAAENAALPPSARRECVKGRAHVLKPTCRHGACIGQTKTASASTSTTRNARRPARKPKSRSPNSVPDRIRN